VRARRGATVLALLATAVGVSACMGHRHYQVGRDEFRSKLATIGSMDASHLIGSDQDRAYLTRWQMGILFGPANDIYSVALAELTTEERAALLAHEDPWACKIAKPTAESVGNPHETR
jgi:hypothetical protein